MFLPLHKTSTSRTSSSSIPWWGPSLTQLRSTVRASSVLRVAKTRVIARGFGVIESMWRRSLSKLWKMSSPQSFSIRLRIDLGKQWTNCCLLHGWIPIRAAFETEYQMLCHCPEVLEKGRWRGIYSSIFEISPKTQQSWNRLRCVGACAACNSSEFCRQSDLPSKTGAWL
jgi:hypothetical protein